MRRIWKKTHGVADARGLSGAEIAGLDLKAREALARKEKTTVAGYSTSESRHEQFLFPSLDLNSCCFHLTCM
jgi:hypothetical protein